MSHRSYSGVGCTFISGICFLLIGTAMMAVAFSTHHWIDSYVDREKLIRHGMEPKDINEPIFFNRFRGLFMTCYSDDASFLDEPPYVEKVKDGRCLAEEGYEVPLRSTDTLAYGSYYEVRIHLMRTHFATLLLTLVFLAAALITAIAGWWQHEAHLMRSTAILSFVAMFCAGAGTAIFHGYQYLEVNVLSEVRYMPAWLDKQAQVNGQYKDLIQNSRSQFGYSYMLLWLSLICCAVSTILFSVRSYKLQFDSTRSSHTKKPRQDRTYYVNYDYPSPNFTYFEHSPYDFGGSYRY